MRASVADQVSGKVSRGMVGPARQIELRSSAMAANNCSLVDISVCTHRRAARATFLLQMLLHEIPGGLIVKFVFAFEDFVLEAAGEVQFFVILR